MNGYVRVQFYAKDLLGKFVLTQKNQVGQIVAHDEHNSIVVKFKKSPTKVHLWMMQLSELRGMKVFDSEEDAQEAQNEK